MARGAWTDPPPAGVVRNGSQRAFSDHTATATDDAGAASAGDGAPPDEHDPARAGATVGDGTPPDDGREESRGPLLATGLATLRAHPRHLVLAALVAGLLLPHAGPALVLPAAIIAALAGRVPVAAAAVAALLAGAGIADARLAALDEGVLAHSTGRATTARAVVLEPLRERAAGPAVARIRLLEGLGAGEQAVLRVRPSAYAGRLWSPDDELGGALGAPGPDDGASATPRRGDGTPAAPRRGDGEPEAAPRRGYEPASPDTRAPSRGWPEVGDVVLVRGTIEPLGTYDAYQARRSAHAAIKATRVVPTGTRRNGVQGALDGVRRTAERALESGLGEREAALLRGMVLGEDERLTQRVREEFQASGLAHILAVSGQNVMLLIVLTLALCALVGVPLRARIVLAAVLVVIYVPLAGGGPSIQRAGVMGVAGLIAALAGRPTRRWYALLLAAAGTLALNPRAAGEPGWQLSFAAVAALLVGAAPLSNALGRKIPKPVADVAAITIAATIGTAPLMALHFGAVSLAALPANLLAAPAIAPVMWLGVLAAAAAQLAAPLAVPLSALTGPLLVYIQAVAHITGSTSLSVLHVSASPLEIALATLAIPVAVALAAQRWRRRRRRRTRQAAATLAIAVAATLALAGTVGGGEHAPPPRPGELRVTFLDVGQGDATLIERDGTTVLVDTGPPGGQILDRLEQAGVKRLDALLLTHAEADHEGEAPAVIERYRPRLIADAGMGWPSPVQRKLPRATTAIGAQRVLPEAGQTITIGRLRFEVLWPPPGRKPAGDPNDLALVARLEAGAFSMLLSADAESHVTSTLPLEPVDVLKVAHHGSADPGLPALLQRLKPRVAAVLTGENDYGHPTPSTIAALKRAVPRTVRTDQDGTIRLRANGDRIWVE